MAKKVVNIVKSDKEKRAEKRRRESSELFNLNEEIVIGINSKKVVDSKKNKKKNPKIKKSNSIKSNTKKPRSKVSVTVEKKPVKKHRGLKWFILAVLLLGAIVATLLSPLFNIKTIVVKNNSKVSKEEIISLSQIQLGENTFKYLNINVMQKIKENSYIEDVKIKRNYPSEIVITVKERADEYIIKIGEMSASINRQGYVLEVSEQGYDLPVISGFKTDVLDMVSGSRLVDEDLLVLEKINMLDSNANECGIKGRILGYEIDGDEIVMTLDDEKIAHIKNFTNLNIKMLSLKNVLERTAGIAGEVFLDGQSGESSILFRENI